MRGWLPEVEVIQVTRFLGTSPDSSSIIPMLTSVCEQIAINFEEPRDNIPDELSPLVQHFKKTLTLANDGITS